VAVEFNTLIRQNQQTMPEEPCARLVTADGLESEVAQLYEQHATPLLRYARCKAGSEETAREGLQEAFLRYFIERSYGREIINPKAWLFEVLRNYISDRACSLAARREIPAEHLDRVPDMSQNPYLLVEGLQIAQELAATLSERELECLRLRTEGFSYGEIGAAMQVRTGTVGATLARAYEKIRQHANAGGGAKTTLAAAVFCLVQETEPCTLG
jgi:RNA polymerase sigma-70 factor (ECF subfamily)